MKTIACIMYLAWKGEFEVKQSRLVSLAHEYEEQAKQDCAADPAWDAPAVDIDRKMSMRPITELVAQGTRADVSDGLACRTG